MILKIERYYEQDWWMLDDIRKVSKAHFQQDFKKDFETGQADIFILDLEKYLNKKAGDKKVKRSSREVVRLIYRLSNGNEFSVIFDTMAYLCNDEGKTIEKIVANYR
jgi:hypothetical protein